MAEWIGQLLSGMPIWIVIVAVVMISITWFVVTWVIDVLPWKSKRVYLGEKKNAKK